MRAVAALEAAWADDNDALAALVRRGHGEQPLAVLVARYGASRVQSMVLVVTGIAGLDGAGREEALAELREGARSRQVCPGADIHWTKLAVDPGLSRAGCRSLLADSSAGQASYRHHTA